MIKGEMTIQAVKGHYVQALDSPLQRIDTDYLSSVQIVKTHFAHGLDSSVSPIERIFSIGDNN